MRFIPIFIFLFATHLSGQLARSGQFRITPSNVTVLRGQPDGAMKLFDNNIQTGWFSGWNLGDYPTKILVEFDSAIFLSKVRYYDWVGKTDFTIKTIHGNILMDRKLNQYGVWQEFNFSYKQKISQIVLEYEDIQGDIPITEIEFYFGKLPSDNEIRSNSISGDASKIGVNGFHWIPMDLNPTGLLRMYQMFQWTWTDYEGEIAVEPTRQADGNYDSFLADAKRKNIDIIFCINKIPDWYADKIGDEWPDKRIHPSDMSGNDPMSYFDVSQYAWQICARYGSKQYSSDLINVNKIPRWNGDPVNVEKSGLNLIKYIEIENEPDRPWKSAQYKYSPQQLAAFMSAIWDGHENKFGRRCGIKNADPNIKVVLPGLAWLNTWYISEMKKWFEENRKDKQFCADVLNFHHYNNAKNPWPGIEVNLWEGQGCQPEDDHMEFRLKELNLWCRNNLPRCEVWLSEFGYDTNPPSTNLSQYPKLHSGKSAEVLQGQWILRTYMYAIASGMDKIFMFNLCDEDSAERGYLFGSSGLLTSERTGFKKKQSWKDVNWLIKELNGYKFYKDRSENGVKIFEFRTRLNQSKYFYFSPTSENKNIQFKIGNFQLTATEDIKVHHIYRAFNTKITFNKTQEGRQ